MSEKFVNSMLTNIGTLSTRPTWDHYWRWLWLIAFFGGLVFTVRDVTTISRSPVQFEVVHRLAAALIIGFFVYPCVLRSPVYLFRGIIALLSIFTLWRLLSGFWSVNPLWTVYRSLEYLVILSLMTYTAASIKNLVELEKWVNLVWGFILFSVACVWIGLALFPDKALKPTGTIDAIFPFMLSSIFPYSSSNGVATWGGIIALIGFARLVRDKRNILTRLFMCLIGIVTMVLAQGRSAMAGFMIGIILILVLNRRFGLLCFLFVSIFASATIVSDIYLWNLLSRGQSDELFFSFSGRLVTWDYAWDYYIKENALMGYGAFAGGRFLVLADQGLDLTSTMENTWLEVMMDIGVFGIIPLAIVLFCVWKILLRTAWTTRGLEAQLAVELAAVMAMSMTRSFFTTTYILHNDYTFFLAVGCSVCFVRLSKAKRRRDYINNPTDVNNI
jgi:hypothetical protein